MSFKTIAGRSDGVFWWFPALSEDLEEKKLNSPKWSFGFKSCNALLFSILEKDYFKIAKFLQTVQTNAARLVESPKRRDPIAPMLMCLHWLHVDKRIFFIKGEVQ